MAETLNQLLERIQRLSQEVPQTVTRVTYAEGVLAACARAMEVMRAAIDAAPASCDHLKHQLSSVLGEASSQLYSLRDDAVDERQFFERALSDAQMKLRDVEMRPQRSRPRP